VVDDGDRRADLRPDLGGYISDNYHWGWIFFINVPIGAVVVLMTLQSLRGAKPAPNSGVSTASAWRC
jgi:predicted MFS family arabinose efflux permease